MGNQKNEYSEETPRKTKIAFKHIVRTENHGHRKEALVMLNISYDIFHIEYA